MIVEHRHYALPQKLRARFGLIFIMPLLAGAISGGCSTIDRPVETLVSEATRTSPPAMTVRAQNDEPAAGVVPPNAAPSPSSDPTRVLPEGSAPEEPGAQPAPPSTSATPRVVTGALDTALESLFGEASTSDWTPLPFATLFTEGWNQPFVFSPASDSGALRQEWINAANGVFCRQWVLQGIHGLGRGQQFGSHGSQRSVGRYPDDPAGHLVPHCPGRLVSLRSRDSAGRASGRGLWYVLPVGQAMVRSDPT